MKYYGDTLDERNCEIITQHKTRYRLYVIVKYCGNYELHNARLIDINEVDLNDKSKLFVSSNKDSIIEYLKDFKHNHKTLFDYVVCSAMNNLIFDMRKQ